MALEPRAGQKVFTLQTVPAGPPEGEKKSVAQAAGFSLHGIGIDFLALIGFHANARVPQSNETT